MPLGRDLALPYQRAGLLLQVVEQREGLQGCNLADVQSQQLLRQDCCDLLCIHTRQGLIMVFSLPTYPPNSGGSEGAEGMGTIQIRKAKDGTLSYRCRVQRRGYPVQSATFPTKQEARRWGQMVEGEIATGRHFAPKSTPMTFAEFLVKYQAAIQPRKTPMTQRDQASTLKYWHRVLGHKLLAEITPRDLAEQRDVLLKTKKTSTVLHQLRVLSAVFTAAVKDFAVLETNPMFKVRMPAQPQGRIRYLDDSEREGYSWRANLARMNISMGWYSVLFPRV